jgi:hypothetical protein
MVIMIAIGPKVRGFERGRGRWILRPIQIRSTTFFGGEIKPTIPCRKILQHIKYLDSMKEILVGKIHRLSL